MAIELYEMMQSIRAYHRNLPHFHPEQGCFFLTYRLINSIPVERISEFELMKVKLKKSGNLSKKELRAQRSLHFQQFESSLDHAINGPTWLKHDAVAEIVADSLKFYDSVQYDLLSFCIMSNHVHAVLNLLKNSLPLSTLLQRHKGFTARECNKVLNRSGSFWHPESYDHVIRNPDELQRIVEYTLNNPVKAGLVSHWKQWKWNYVKPGLVG